MSTKAHQAFRAVLVHQGAHETFLPTCQRKHLAVAILSSAALPHSVVAVFFSKFLHVATMFVGLTISKHALHVVEVSQFQTKVFSEHLDGLLVVAVGGGGLTCPNLWICIWFGCICLQCELLDTMLLQMKWYPVHSNLSARCWAIYAIPPEIAFGGRHHPGVVANGEPPPISDVLAQLPPNPAPQPPPFTSSLIRPGVCVWT